jgi:hypothetical protein
VPEKDKNTKNVKKIDKKNYTMEDGKRKQIK